MDGVDVQQRARSFIANLDVRSIKDDLSVYVKAANAVLLEEELGPGESGTTFTRPDGRHIITVNSLENEVRQRFTICHEIAHIVLDLPSVHSDVPSWSYAKRDPNEIACDAFAAELLMPYRLWQERLPGDDLSLEILEYMATEFGCSYPAAASRYANLAQIPCAFVTMERGTIRYAARSVPLRRTNAWIPPRTPIPNGSLADRLRREGRSQTVTGEVAQDVWIQDGDGSLDLSEICRHYRSSDTTLSLLWFDNDTVPERETDRFGRNVEEDEGLRELTGELTWPSGHRRR